MQDEMTVPDGPAACYSTLPIRVIIAAMRGRRLRRHLRLRGTFCCNHLMYGIL